MNYTVSWHGAAEAELTTLWLGSRARHLITASAHAIDSQLSINPKERGESRPDGSRIYHVAPLGVIFAVDEMDKSVLIKAVWEFKTRPKKM